MSTLTFSRNIYIFKIGILRLESELIKSYLGELKEKKHPFRVRSFLVLERTSTGKSQSQR